MNELALTYLDFCEGQPTVTGLKQWCEANGEEFTTHLLNIVLELSLNDE